MWDFSECEASAGRSGSASSHNKPLDLGMATTQAVQQCGSLTLRVKVRQVAQQVAQREADLAVHVSHLRGAHRDGGTCLAQGWHNVGYAAQLRAVGKLPMWQAGTVFCHRQHLLSNWQNTAHLADDAAADEHIGGVVHRGHPQAQHISAIGRVLLGVLPSEQWRVGGGMPGAWGDVGEDRAVTRRTQEHASAGKLLCTQPSSNRTLPPIITVRGSITLPRLLLIFMPASAVVGTKGLGWLHDSSERCAA